MSINVMMAGSYATATTPMLCRAGTSNYTIIMHETSNIDWPLLVLRTH